MEESAVNEWTVMYQYLWKQLDFEYLLMDYPLEWDSLEEILEILVDTCCSNRKMIRMAGDDESIHRTRKHLIVMQYVKEVNALAEKKKQNKK